MTDVTRIINAIQKGEKGATDELLPLVYEELRLLAAQKMAQEKAGQTLQATALVHEAYLRLIGTEDQKWDSKGHFFRAAAEAMRRILIDNARRKKSLKHGGEVKRIDLDEADLSADTSWDTNDLIALDQALTKLSESDAVIADLVKMHCFAGLPLANAAEILGVSSRTGERYWAFAKTWLYKAISGEQDVPSP